MSFESPPSVADDSVPPPTKVCPKCSVQSQTSGEYCPHCGSSYSRQRRRPGRKSTIGALALLVLLLAVGIGVTLKVRADRADERRVDAAAARAVELKAEQEEKAAADAAAAEAAAAEKRRQEKRAAENAERVLRASAIREMQRTITKDAQESADDGVLDGPILYTSCSPLGGGSADDLTAITTTFDCLAVTEELDDGRASGYSYNATMNWDTGSYTWQLG